MRADDLIALLEVARTGSLNAAASTLGVTHSTLSRRLDGLEKSSGTPLLSRTKTGCTLTEAGRQMLPAAESIEKALAHAKSAIDDSDPMTGVVRIAAPEGFAAHFAAPALTTLRQRHRLLSFELTAATRPLVQGRGVDIEISVGDAPSPRLSVIALAKYRLGVYATAAYLAEHGTPKTVQDLDQHTIVYYVEGSLRVHDLQVIDTLFAREAVKIGCTSIWGQLEFTRAGAGIGLLPAYLAKSHGDLVPILADQVHVRLDYVASLAPTAVRRAPVIAALNALRQELRDRRHELG